MVKVRAACQSLFELKEIGLGNTVGELKTSIRERMGVEEELQILKLGRNILNNDETVLGDILMNEESLIMLHYDLDGSGLCYCCLCLKFEGGGCGCCPVERWGFCWEDWPDENDDDEKKGQAILCNLL